MGSSSGLTGVTSRIMVCETIWKLDQFMKFSVTATLLSTLLFSACHKGTEYNYFNKKAAEVTFTDNINGDDDFMFGVGNRDFDGEYIEIEYRGNFIKDSVDEAVKQYYETGKIPRKNDLF